jgi:hypothetical protein
MLAVLFPLWLVSILLLATAQDGATSVLHGLTCPEVDEHITREEFCDSVEDCSNRADANTTHPDGPCVSEYGAAEFVIKYYKYGSFHFNLL